jgi:dTDP-4-dehydrorhamnose reductase
MSISGEPVALVTGAGGQLGQLLAALAPPEWTVRAFPSGSLDVRDADAVQAALLRDRPTVVFNLAAYTAVDAAEAHPSEAEAVNGRGAANVADGARRVGARLVHLSTDFVFDGCQGRPYLPDARPNPLNVYGRTKLAGEQAVHRSGPADAVILRTQWLHATRGRNFVHAMLHAMRERPEVGVVSDQVGSPTSARGLAAALWALAGRPTVGGILHWADAGVASWYDFAVAIQEEGLALGLLDRPVRVHPIRTGEFPAAARRPAFSVLDTADACRALGVTPEHWRVGLRETLAGLTRG